jgi:NAD(P)-dependent dehydrogenase (short-subunit alcohol dehydrogenase family)
MTQRFAHQSVIVTGAGSGIGLATASGFAQEGASVMVADLSARRAQAAVEAIQAQGVLPFGVKWMLPSLTMWKARFKQHLTPLGGSTSWSITRATEYLCPSNPSPSKTGTAPWQ